MVFLLLSVVTTGCFGSEQNSETENTENASTEEFIQQPEEKVEGTAPPMGNGGEEVPTLSESEIEDHDSLAVYNLFVRWELALEDILNKYDIPESAHNQYNLRSIRFNWNGDMDHYWGELERYLARLSGYTRVDNGRIDRLYLSGKQTNFDDEALMRLQPFYELFIATTNPNLTAQERSDIMRDLHLEDTDAETLIEKSSPDGNNKITVNDVRYDVAYIGSSEGITYALIATLSTDCQTDSILNSCRKN